MRGGLFFFPVFSFFFFICFLYLSCEGSGGVYFSCFLSFHCNCFLSFRREINVGGGGLFYLFCFVLFSCVEFFFHYNLFAFDFFFLFIRGGFFFFPVLSFSFLLLHFLSFNFFVFV